MMAALVAVVTLATVGLLTPSQAGEYHKRAGMTVNASDAVVSLTQPLAVNGSRSDQSEDQGSASSQPSTASERISATSGNPATSTAQDPPTEPTREADSLDELLKLEKQLDEASRWYWNKELDAVR